jgi:hypothetical protein
MINSVFKRAADSPVRSFDWSAGLVQSGINVARAGSATFVGSNSLIQSALQDTQRIDWSNGYPALLVEGSANNYLQDNLIQNSVGTTGANNVWFMSSNMFVTNNAGVSPDGTSNAALVAITTNTSFKAIQHWTNRSVTGNYTLTFYVKPNGSDANCSLRFASSSFYASYMQYAFSLSGSGSVGAASFAGSDVSEAASPYIRSVGNGWYKIKISANVSSATNISMVLFPGTRSAQTVNSSLFFWGAQLEDGTDETSLIFTTNATGTRNADVVTLSDFADFWRAGKGSALVRARPSTVAGIRPLIQFDDGTADNIIALRGNNTNPELYVRTGGVDQAQIDAGTIAANTSYRLAGAWAENSCAASLNSGTPVLDGVATIPTVTQARLGSDGTNYLNGHIEAIEYYDERIPNSGLQVVSSAAGYQSIIGSVFRDAIIS